MADLFNRPAAAKERPKVLWADMQPQVFNARKDELLPKLRQHMAELVALKKSNKAGEDYLKYLTAHCGFWLEFNDFADIFNRRDKNKV